MSAVFSDYDSNKALGNITGNVPVSTAVLHLYQNNHTPADADTVSAYTECTFAGYAAQSITGWTTPTATGHVSRSTATKLTFTRTSTGTTQTVYGYYVTDAGGTNLLWAELDPSSPIPITNNGDTYAVTPSRQQASAL